MKKYEEGEVVGGRKDGVVGGKREGGDGHNGRERDRWLVGERDNTSLLPDLAFGKKK